MSPNWKIGRRLSCSAKDVGGTVAGYGVGLVKFDTIWEHDTNPTRFLLVWVEYNSIWVIFVLTCLTRLINGSYSF